jgi:hypothetical protein
MLGKRRVERKELTFKGDMNMTGTLFFLTFSGHVVLFFILNILFCFDLKPEYHVPIIGTLFRNQIFEIIKKIKRDYLW